MSFSHKIKQVWTGPDGRQITSEETYSGDSQGPSLDVTVPDESSDMLVNFALDVSQIKAIYIVADQDVTLETNDSGSPDDTISLAAGVPYVWTTDSYDSCLLTADITKLYFTNASGSEATVQLEVVHDATP